MNRTRKPTPLAGVPLDAGRVVNDLQVALHAEPAGSEVKAAVRRIVAQAGLSRATALPCAPEVSRFLKRLGWIPPHAQGRRVQTAYTDFIAEVGRRRGIDALSTSLYLRLHAGSGGVEGAAAPCLATPDCARCACVSYCAHALRSGETADELNRMKSALDAGRGEELADEDLVAILWDGAQVEPAGVDAARRMLATGAAGEGLADSGGFANSSRAADGPAGGRAAGNAESGTGGTAAEPPRELGVSQIHALAGGRVPVASGRDPKSDDDDGRDGAANPPAQAPGRARAGTAQAGAGLRGLLALDGLELRRRLGQTAADADHRLRLLAAAEICRRWARDQVQTGRPILTARDLFEVFHLLLRDCPHENFYVGLLDNKHRLFRALRVSEGTINTAPIHPREVFAPAIRAQATAVVFVHNHPSGDPAPSRDDLTVTRRLNQAAELLGLTILDHVIIGDGVYYSFAESGKL
ncbi:MAG: JAB domain-containing protein [Planctomycetota bacterium]